MKKGLTIFIMLCVLTAALLGCSPASAPQENVNTPQSGDTSTPPPSTESTPEPLEGEVVSLKIPAPSLSNSIVETADEQSICIYLPPSYNEGDKRYPVVYYLHGHGESHVISGYGKIFDRTMGSLLAEGKAAEMIIVTVSGAASFYVNSPVIGNWQDYLTKDVVEYIDENYRTIAEADSRALTGFSMGGFGVLNAAMRTSGIYSHFYSMSPGVFDENGLSKSDVNFENPSDVFTIDYGKAFAPDPDGGPPYILLPEMDAQGNAVHDDVWKMYNAGYGNIPEKLDTYKDNLLSAKTLVIEYGDKDEYEWIPEGCRYMSGLMKERDIPHELLEYSGTHGGQVPIRFRDVMLPMLSEAFGAGE